MAGIKGISFYSNPKEVGYDAAIETEACHYFVREDTGAIVGPYVDGQLVDSLPPSVVSE